MDSYKESIFEPLEYYRDYAKEEHKKNTDEHFDTLVEKSKINVEENRETAKKHREKTDLASKIRAKIDRCRSIRTAVIILSIFLFVLSFIPILIDTAEIALKIGLPIAFLAIGALAIFLVFRKTKSKLTALSDTLKVTEAEANRLLSKAYAQMAPLNALFTDNDAFKLMEKTMPQVSFDKQFLNKNLEDMKNNYGFNDGMGNKSSVVDAVSGKLYKNPFLLERFVTEEIVQHTYTGTLTISWTTYSRDSKGNRVARRHVQTLVAHVVKPKPVYNFTTLTNYGSQAAPDLSFSRENKHFEDMSDRELARKIKKGERKLKKKAEKAIRTNSSFTQMSNTEFDVLFDASNRDNELQYRILFTPLAQKEMIDLIRSDVGYGDDFDFFKNKKMNTIRSEHSQRALLSPAASHYYSYDVDDARAKFNKINNEFFKSLYFDFAPLIAIPAYQEPPTASFEEISQQNTGFTEYNYEMIANKLGARHFAHERTDTDSILKTELIKRDNDYDTVAVTAYSYSAEPRMTLVPKLGGDGRMHAVPVHWKEYIPLQKTSLMSVKNIGITETEYEEKKRAYADSSFDGAACYKGIFAHTSGSKNIKDFINSIKTKGD